MTHHDAFAFLIVRARAQEDFIGRSVICVIRHAEIIAPVGTGNLKGGHHEQDREPEVVARVPG